eukprot:TRINITY_DN5554_c0_g1_i1.p1 TRINITY_DN5554_c0_g1~~TRINITY_DN5554_c0_g1_i1.p1  ORF type:complete len:141 (+),score=16.43 TRINITY_DN5554_c0_g1_i1:37-423(+)
MSSGIMFCSDCANMLYPKIIEDQLNYSCRSCDHVEQVEDLRKLRIHHNQISTTTEVDLPSSARDMFEDPTLRRVESGKITCPFCESKHPVVFCEQSRTREKGIELFYVCSNSDCRTVWQDITKTNTEE